MKTVTIDYSLHDHLKSIGCTKGQNYEWRGILKVISALKKLDQATTWLDYGCGNGGLVRYCRTHLPANTLVLLVSSFK